MTVSFSRRATMCARVCVSVFVSWGWWCMYFGGLCTWKKSAGFVYLCTSMYVGARVIVRQQNKCESEIVKKIGNLMWSLGFQMEMVDWFEVFVRG